METKGIHKDIRKELLSRLKKVEGQVRGVYRMIEEERNCGEIVIQLAAIKSAVNRVGFSVLGCHLASCIEEGISRGNEPEQSLAEFMSVLKKFS
ncbi:MAG: metal-sensitive transcriptional regulator [Firmicutes bacterium]|nr:metal-sensitive transcriptional regulator [Bacillota bacterium]